LGDERHTRFLTPEEAEETRKALSNKQVDTGIRLEDRGSEVVTEPLLVAGHARTFEKEEQPFEKSLSDRKFSHRRPTEDAPSFMEGKNRRTQKLIIGNAPFRSMFLTQ
jgi:hypothetical protein